MVVGSPIVLNLIPGGVMPVIMINETDKGYQKEFLIYNGNTPYNVPGNVSATIRGTKRDGLGVTEAATVTAGSNVVRITVTEQMTAVPGENIFELVFVDTNGLRVATINFIMLVERSALNANTVISESDIAYSEQVLNQLQGVEAYYNKFENEKITRFATCADMKASTALKSGMVCQTAGYYAINDGGAALYYVMGSAPVSDHYETLQNGLIAILIKNDVVNPVMFGAKGDGITDDTVAVQNAINYADTVDGLGKTYLVRPTELVPGQTTYKAISVTKDTVIRNGTFKMDADVERGTCVFGINNSGIITFYNVVIDGNVSAQTVVTGDGANHGIAIPREGGQGTVRLIGCTVKACRTDGIMHRAGFLEILESTVINGYRNGITCDRSAHIAYSTFDSSQSQTAPNTSIYHEPNEGYGFKGIRIHIEHCGFNADKTGVGIFCADSTSELREIIVENCYCTDDEGRWRCSVESVDGPVYRVLIKDNDRVGIAISSRDITDFPTSYMENVILDGNIVSGITFGDANSTGGLSLKNLTLRNMDLRNKPRIMSRTRPSVSLILDNCKFGFDPTASLPTGTDGALYFLPRAFLNVEMILIKGCLFSYGRFGMDQYQNPPDGYNIAKRLYIEDTVFENMYGFCLNIRAKEIYIKGVRVRRDTGFSPSSSENFFLVQANLNDFVMASDCVFYMTEAKTWRTTNNVNAVNCIYSYTEPTTEGS